MTYNSNNFKLFNIYKKKLINYNPFVGVLKDDNLCPYCSAMLFLNENSSICCSNGKVKLRPLHPPTNELINLYSGQCAKGKEFLNNIRAYNAKFAFTSLGTKNICIPGRGPPTFRISGRIHHFIGSLLAPQDKEAVFAQVYVHDEQEQERIRSNGTLNGENITILNNIINRVNPYAARFKQIAAEGSDRKYVLKEKIGDDRRRYNAPTSSEIAILMPGDGSMETSYRDVVINSRGGGLRRINEMNPSYDPMHYPLMFPFGDFGWANDLEKSGNNRNITLKQFYAFRIMQRVDEFSLIIRSKRLFHEYLVDQYAKIETSRLDFLRNNQSTIRAELYQGD